MRKGGWKREQKEKNDKMVSNTREKTKTITAGVGKEVMRRARFEHAKLYRLGFPIPSGPEVYSFVLIGDLKSFAVDLSGLPPQ